MGGQRHDPSALPPGKDPVPIVQESGWVPRAGLDRWGKSRPPPGFDPRPVQPVLTTNYHHLYNTYVYTPLHFSSLCSRIVRILQTGNKLSQTFLPPFAHPLLHRITTRQTSDSYTMFIPVSKMCLSYSQTSLYTHFSRCRY